VSVCGLDAVSIHMSQLPSNLYLSGDEHKPSRCLHTTESVFRMLTPLKLNLYRRINSFVCLYTSVFLCSLVVSSLYETHKMEA
jgi:hypothetical protein